MSDWIEIDNNKWMVEKKTTIDNVKVTVSMSPYDLPQSIKGDVKGDELIIEFEYITGERTRKESHDNDISFEVGIHSRRIYKMFLNLKSLGGKQLEVIVRKFEELVDKVFKNLLKHSSEQNRRDYYTMTQEVIKDHTRELIDPVLNQKA